MGGCCSIRDVDVRKRHGNKEGRQRGGGVEGGWGFRSVNTH